MAGSLMGWILIGLVAGVVVRLMWPGHEPGGFVTPMLVGIAGALLGGYLVRAFAIWQPGHPAGWAASAGGSIAVLLGYRFVVARRQ